MTIIKILREAYIKCEDGIEKYIYYIKRDFENGKIKNVNSKLEQEIEKHKKIVVILEKLKEKIGNNTQMLFLNDQAKDSTRAQSL